jgi:POT family proton-dependent oligopeptide transporter
MPGGDEVNPADRFGGHPKGLLVVVAATVWESFALAAMKAGLVFYIVDELHIAQKSAVEIYGYTTAAMYFMALVGGSLADRWFGLRRATMLGAVLMGLGFFLLIEPRLLFPALTLVCIGNGLFKPTALAQVGLLYSEQDPRRDRGFNLCYVGMNFGALVAPLVSGSIALFYGWTWSFLAAAVGMLVSVAIYWLGRMYVPDVRRAGPQQVEVTQDTVPHHPVTTPLAAVLVWIGGAMFWSVYSQVGSTFALWAENDVARSIEMFGRTMIVPAAWLQSVNPILVIMAGPLINMLWARSKAPGGTRTELRKMIQGICMLALAFLIFAAAHVAADSDGVSLVIVLLAFVPFTIGELYVAPVGQALFSRLAPRGHASLFMAIWILTMTSGYVVSGMLGGLWSRSSPHDFFAGMAALAFVGAVILFIAQRASPAVARPAGAHD